MKWREGPVVCSKKEPHLLKDKFLVKFLTKCIVREVSKS